MNTFNPNDNKTFNVDNYEIEDLLGILDLSVDAPINKEKINERIKLLKYRLRNNTKKEKIFNFLDKASNKLKKAFDDFNKETWTESYEVDESEASNVFKNQYQNRNDPTKNLIINEQSNIIGRVRQTLQDKMAIQGTVQGDKNPIQRKTIKRVVNFDSHYREILDPSGTTCTNDEFAAANPQVRLYTSTNYTVNLNQPLLNVVDITVDSVEIPYSWHVFSEDYGTNRFEIEIDDHHWNIQETFDVIIPSGNYSSGSQLISAINQALNTLIFTDQSSSPIYNNPGADYKPLGLDPTGAWANFFNTQNTPYIYFEYDALFNKTIIHVNQKTKFKWYIEDDEASGCSSSFRENDNAILQPPKPGNKINYNLGWLLGFRAQSLEISHITSYNVGKFINRQVIFAQGSIRSPSTIDLYGPKYFLLTLDDFNNNKPNKDLISLIDNNTNNFKLPGYYKPQSMNESVYVVGDDGIKYQPGYNNTAGYECVDVAGPPSDRGCAENDINIDLISNLTQRQRYSVAQMIQANTTSNRKPRYSSPNSTDVLLRIPVSTPPSNANQIISFKNENPEETKRVYFGPVKLRKFNVRLLNDKGFEVNLNDRDWSFSIIVNQLYQF
tara:strand:+ start:427 stop:2256 length:1830 start_codon:yes stop_codon:yes gene_type:complete